ncbi:fimbria/pilus outer membrane usher protein [Vogesella sp. LIG4]|uniref:fimbria/pilus outer membrane usher protein n=1 Tax=Vogesella sp. LIG4 TaxID=1192162 RepID=UPI00081F7A10|nr:fimbria/pilus outer membrane usher protein [Vogesella sp. LIG4]SCK16969.1 outer membrane usher protein [Vogesella sp. LIG4]
MKKKCEIVQESNFGNLKPLSLILFSIFSSPFAFSDSLQTATQMQALNNVEFNSNLLDLPADSKKAALQRFSSSGSALPGSYRADVYVNEYWVARRDVLIRENKEKGGSNICITPTLLNDIGLDFNRLPAESQSLQNLPANSCLDNMAAIPGMSASFDGGALRLDFGLPQIYQLRTARGYVSPDKWTTGTPVAGFLNYNLNAYHNRQDNAGENSQYYLNALAGLNLGAWRLRYNGSLSQQLSGDNRQTQYQRLSAYAQRDLTAWHSTLTVGESYTPGDLFNSFGFRGVQIRSDDRMLPDSVRGYAPIVRGVAESNAKVAIRQGGNLIYETTVPPGPFQIDDLYNTGYAGDLTVTVTESDGRSKEFLIPYAAVPQLLREGMDRFSLTAGELRASQNSSKPGFVQGNYQRGINNSLTMYGGSLAANHYFAAQLGAAVSTAAGAFAVDVSHSQADFSNSPASALGDMKGQSYRVTYSKLLAPTQTNVTVAAYRYSTRGYMEFPDFAYTQMQGSRLAPLKSRFMVNISQPLAAGWGNLNLSGSTQEYWNQSGRDLQYQFGYGNVFKSFSYGLTASRSKDVTGRHINQYMLSITVPLGKSTYAPTLSSTVTADNQHNRSGQVSLSGVAGELRNMNYSVYAGNTDQNGDTSESYGAYGQYSGSLGSLTASISRAGGNTQQMLGVNGGMVFHPGGVTLSQTVGEAIAVVEAKGAEGASLSNMNGTRINSQGYAVATSLMPYRLNDISVDPKSMSEDVELQESSSKIAPTSGAIVMVKFPTKQGKAAMVNVKMASGDNAPLGADVLQADGTPVTIIGQGGMTYLRGLDGQPLRVRWGDDSKQQCSFSYRLPADAQTASSETTQLRKTDAVCQ